MEETKHILKEDLLFLYDKIRIQRNFLREKLEDVKTDYRESQMIKCKIIGIDLALPEFDNFLKELE